jgi:hypothetical protein
MASNKDRLSHSPQSIRKGNADPYHDDSEVQIEVDTPRRGGEQTTRDGGGDPWRHQGERYSPKYEAPGHKPRGR